MGRSLAQALICVIAIAQPIRAMAQCAITDLGTLGGNYSAAYAINNRGQITGTAETAAGVQHAFLWENGRMADLHPPDSGWPMSSGLAISEAGEVSGSCDGNRFPWSIACRLTSGVPIYLSQPGLDSKVLAVSGSGVLAGRSGGSPALWQGGVVTMLPGGDGEARDVNAAGQVVYFVRGAEGYESFLWQNGTVTRLHSLGGQHAEVTCINAAGTAAGTASTDTKIMRACVWQAGTVTELPCPYEARSVARDINRAGWIVGAFQERGDTATACLWQTGRLAPLSGLLGEPSEWVLQQAESINDRGEITGYGTVKGQTHAFLLSPPEGIAAVRGTAAGLPARVDTAVVTATFAGFFYVEDPARSQGLRVNWQNAPPQPGDLVSLLGTRTETAYGEPCLDAALVSVLGSIRPPAPRSMSLADACSGVFQPSGGTVLSALTATRPGVSVTGLLVRCSGRVMDAAQERFQLADGSQPWPVDILMPGEWTPGTGAYLAVTGVASFSQGTDARARAILCQGTQDITVIQEAGGHVTEE